MCLQSLGSRPARKRISHRTPDNVLFKKQMNTLQRDILRFWNADHRKKNHEHTAGPENQICAIGDIGQHYRRDFCYDKVEEPLRHECCGEDEASHAVGRALGAQDEGDGTPAEGVEKDLEYSRSGLKFRVNLISRAIEVARGESVKSSALAECRTAEISILSYGCKPWNDYLRRYKHKL